MQGILILLSISMVTPNTSYEWNFLIHFLSSDHFNTVEYFLRSQSREWGKAFPPTLSLRLSRSSVSHSVWRQAALTCVGVMWLMSSDASCFRRVVLPALSKPRRRILTSWSGALFNLRKIESKPLNNHEGERLL